MPIDPFGIESNTATLDKPDPLGIERRPAAPTIESNYTRATNSAAPSVAKPDPLGIERPAAAPALSATRPDPFGIEAPRHSPSAPIAPKLPIAITGDSSRPSMSVLTGNMSLPSAPVAAQPAPAPDSVNIPNVVKNATAYETQRLGRPPTPAEVQEIQRRVEQSAAMPAPREAQEAEALRDAGGSADSFTRAFKQGLPESYESPTGAFSVDAAESHRHEQAANAPLADTWKTRAGKVVGNVVGTLPVMGTGALAVPIMTAQGVAGGVAAARTEAQRQREHGYEVTGGQEAKAAIGYGVVQGAINAASAKMFGAAPGGSIPARVGSQVALNAVLGGGSKAAENAIAQQTIDPNRPTMQGVGEATLTGAAQGLLYGFAHEGILKLTGRPPTPEQAQRIEQSKTPQEAQAVVDEVHQQILAQESHIDAGEPQMQRQAQAAQSRMNPKPDPFNLEAGRVLQNFEAKSPAFDKAMEQRREQREIAQENADAQAQIPRFQILEQEGQIDAREPMMRARAETSQGRRQERLGVPEAEPTPEQVLRNFQAKSPTFTKAVEQQRDYRQIQQENADVAARLPQFIEGQELAEEHRQAAQRAAAGEIPPLYREAGDVRPATPRAPLAPEPTATPAEARRTLSEFQRRGPAFDEAMRQRREYRDRQLESGSLEAENIEAEARAARGDVPRISPPQPPGVDALPAPAALETSSPVQSASSLSRAQQEAKDTPASAGHWARKRRDVQNRIAARQKVSDADLKPFEGETFVNNYRAGKVRREKPTDTAAAHRTAITNQLRDLVVEEHGAGISELSASRPLAVQAHRGEVGPGSLISPDTAMKLAGELPADHPARVVLHNLRELEKNPRGTKVQAFHTNDIPDGSRIEMANGSELEVNHSNGTIDGNGISGAIPESGLKLYGRKLLPADERHTPEEVHAALIQSGLDDARAAETIQKLGATDATPQRPIAAGNPVERAGLGKDRALAGEGATGRSQTGGEKFGEPAKGIFGQVVTPKDTGPQQTLAYETDPTKIPAKPLPGTTARDEKIAARYEPEATPEMFPPVADEPWAKGARRGVGLERIRDTSAAVIDSIKGDLYNPEGRLDALRRRLVRETGITGNADEARKVVARYFENLTTHPDGEPMDGSTIQENKKIAKALRDFTGQSSQPTPIEREAPTGKRTPPDELRPPDVSHLPIKVSPDDISFDLAVRAHSGSSFVPERRAFLRQKEYVEHMTRVYESLAPLAKTPEQKQVLAQELERYRTGLIEHTEAILSAESRTMSPMITGPAKFPTSSNQKKLDTAQRRVSEFIEWNDRAQKAMRRKISPESGPISADNPNAPDLLQKKLDQAEKLQRAMVEANKLVRSKSLTDAQKIEQIQALGLSEKTARRVATEKDFAGRTGFADYELQNNNAEIKRLRERIGKIETTRATPASESKFEGGSIVDNPDANRVQIFFDAKPPEDVRAKLKANGFRWAPSEGAWQRQRGANVKELAARLVGAENTPARVSPIGDTPGTPKAAGEKSTVPTGDDFAPSVADLSLTELKAEAQKRGIDPDQQRARLVEQIQAHEALAEESPPATGKLDKITAWADKRLAEKEKARAQKMQGLTPEQRRQRGSAGSLDPEEIALRVIKGAAHASKGIVRFAEWSKAMGEDIADLSETTVRRIYNLARRVAKMDEDTRAVWTMRQFEQGGERSTKSIVREMTGQVDASRAVSEMTALREGLRKAQAASRTGFAAGQEQVQGLKAEFVRIVGENIPGSERYKLMSDVARIKTLGELRLGTVKASRVLADYNLKTSLADLESLVGKMKVQVYRPQLNKAGTSKPGRVAGDIDPSNLREVDLTRLSPEARKEINPLLQEARYLKNRLRLAAAGSSIETKVAAMNRFKEIEQQIRVAAANSLAEKEINIAGKVEQLHHVVGETVKRINAPRESDVPSGEPPHETSLVKAAWRSQYNADALLSKVVGSDHPAYKAAIGDIRRAQVGVYGEQQAYERGLSEHLEAAGLEPHSAGYDRWLSKRETLTLPGAGKIELTRPEMLDLYAHSQDTQTQRDIDNGIEWNFDRNRNGRRVRFTRADVTAIAAKLTPAERAIVDFHKKYITDNITDRAMRAKLALDQRAPEPIPGYWPRARNIKEVETLPGEWGDVQKRRLENIPSMEERGKDRHTPILIRNAIEVMHDFVDDNGHLIHLAEPLRNAAAILQNSEVRAALERRHGPHVNEQIDQFLLDTAGAATRPPRGRSERIVSAIMRNLSRAWLAVNPSPMLKNVFGGSVSLMPEFAETDLAHGIAQASKPGAYQKMIDASPLAWNRYEGGGLYGHYSPLLEKHVTPEARLSSMEALKRFKLGAAVDAIPLMKKADSVPFKVAFHAAEHFIDRTQPGLTGEARQQAILDKFHEATMRTQNGMSSTEISFTASRARQSGPLKQMFIMFQSDANKKLNQFGRWGDMNNTQRSRLLASTAMGAAISALVPYGLKTGASAVGRAITGAPVDPEETKRRNQALVWDAASNVVGMSYLGNVAADFARDLQYGNEGNFSTPVTKIIHDVLGGVTRAAIAGYAWAKTNSDTPEADKAKDRLSKALMGSQESIRTAGGDPTVPLFRLAARSATAAKYTPPDQRQLERRQRVQRTLEIRKSLPGDVQRLLTEKNRLDLTGVDRLSDAEYNRREDLRDIEEDYGDLLEAERAGNASEIKRLRGALSEHAKRLHRAN